MPIIAIVCFRPKRGKSKQLVDLVQEHVPTLRSLGLATARDAIIGRAKDGTIVEVFEWVSQDAIDRAHIDPTVGAMWKRFEKLCSYGTLTDLAEATALFACFEPIELAPKIGAIEWCDITVKDATTLRDFYADVVGYGSVGLDMGGYDDFCMVGSHGGIAAGVCHARGPGKGLPKCWLPYISVADLKRSLQVTKRLGGKAVGKTRAGGGGRYCVIRDPSGAHVALFQRATSAD